MIELKPTAASIDFKPLALVVDFENGPLRFPIETTEEMAQALNNVWITSIDKRTGCARKCPEILLTSLRAAVYEYEKLFGVLDSKLLAFPLFKN